MFGLWVGFAGGVHYSYVTYAERQAKNAAAAATLPTTAAGTGGEGAAAAGGAAAGAGEGAGEGAGSETTKLLAAAAGEDGVDIEAGDQGSTSTNVSGSAGELRGRGPTAA
jgi:hypothetical protein